MSILHSGFLAIIARLNYATRKPAVYGPSAFVSQPFLSETGRGFIALAILAISIVSLPHAAHAGSVLGTPCPYPGITQMDSAKQNILACLLNASGTPVWSIANTASIPTCSQAAGNALGFSNGAFTCLSVTAASAPPPASAPASAPAAAPASPSTSSCSAGESWNGSACASICQSGYNYNATTGGCDSACPSGESWNGSSCSLPSCSTPVNSVWSGSSCACPSGTSLWNCANGGGSGSSGTPTCVVNGSSDPCGGVALTGTHTCPVSTMVWSSGTGCNCPSGTVLWGCPDGVTQICAVNGTGSSGCP
jgi:hypothetical protein